MCDLMWTWVFVVLIASGTKGDYSGIASGTKGDYSDINECEKGVKCGANEVCRSTIGNYTCDCIGGYGRKTRGACTKIEGASFVLSTVWQISAGGDVTNHPDTAENRQKIKQYLTINQQNVTGFAKIEIVTVTIVTISNIDSIRLRRSPGNPPLKQLKVVYILHLVNNTMLQPTISDKFDNEKLALTDVQLEGGPLSTSVDEVYISARSWGDPHITTVDKVEYDFNGHGEYVFLQTGNTMVQVRADYNTPGNKDSTVFVAVAIKDDIGQFEAQLNRTSGVVTVYKDGVVVCSSNDSLRQGVPSNSMFPCGLLSTPPRPVRGVLVGNGRVSFSLKGFGSYLKTLTLQGGSDISITLDGIKHTISHSNLSGLAGGGVNGSMVARNGSLHKATNPKNMFAYGESWRISENESLFNYSLSSGNYSTYNTFSRPTFYEDYLTNITTLFNLNGHQHNDSDIDEFNKTCNESKVRDECLLAIARANDIAAGEAVNINYRHERYLYDMRHNTPPYFTDEMPVLDVYLADNHSVILNLSNYVRDNSTGDILTYTTKTNIPETDFRIDELSGFFNWTVLPSLRFLNDSIKITFTVHDRFNGTVVRHVDVNFCPCNKTSQCDKQHSDECRCDDKYVSGNYCEIPQDPCTVTTCFKQSLCNATNITVDTGPCAPCPKGRNNRFQKDIQTCDDVNECGNLYKGDDKCDVNSNCTNTDGSYICKCHHGYTLELNGFTCTDVDECLNASYRNQCRTHGGVCQNLHGSWNCTCPQHTMWMDVGTKESPLYICQKNHTYVGHVTFISVTDLSDGNIKELVTAKINAALSNNTNEATTDPPLSVRELFVYLTVLNINRIHADKYTNYDVKFTLRFGLPVSAIMLHGVLGSITYLNSNIYETYFTVFNESENKLCEIFNECVSQSTNCLSINGAIYCECKTGFVSSESPNYCKDIDECQNTGACLHGRCENIPGSWICHCPQGYENTTSLSNSTICQDVNECTTQTFCDNGTCINTNGSWHCACNIGFKHTDSKNQSCEDFDECTEYTNACVGDVSPIYPCINLKGSWMCYCHSGHSVDLNVTSKLCLASTTKSPFDVSTAATPTKPSTSTLSTTTTSTTNENVSEKAWQLAMRQEGNAYLTTLCVTNMTIGNCGNSVQLTTSQPV